jgi:hypothetical protein
VADRRRKLERIRRATEAHRPTLAVTLVRPWIVSTRQAPMVDFVRRDAGL